MAREHGTPQAPQLVRVLRAVSQPLLDSLSQLAKPVEQVPSWQVPELQDSLALRRSQVTPQEPQLALELMLVSHPLASVPSQLENPALQLRVEQVPEAQVALALERLQVVPHAPQLVSVVVGVSHPLASLPSQLDQPGLQLRMLHEPEPQVAVALVREQVVPHAPQLVRVVSATSHPLLRFPSQLSNPLSQLTSSQVPVLHDSLAPARLHAAPQAPQLARVVVGVSQPLLSMPSQLAQPALHDEMEQMPLPQLAVALARLHGVPQVPQSLSVRMLVSHPLVTLPSQSLNPALQVAISQVPVEHTPMPEAGVHVTPQTPQLKLVVSGVSHPLARLPSQLDQPALQLSSWQLPVEQLAAPLAKEQVVPQVPQLVRVVVGVSQPLPESASQLAKPVLQLVIWHEPVWQLSLALARSHDTPQAPQLVSELSGVSQPLASTPSQLANPASQPAVWQVPLAQVSAALARAHSMLHSPQSVSVRRLVSQPLLSMPSQLDHPALQLRMPQVPEPQVALALAREQVVPQVPQLARVVVGVSQPLAVLLSQFSKPVSQPTNWQVPVAQVSPAPGRLQVTPQAPQLARVVVGVSQPLLSMPSQLDHPALQELMAQIPLEQLADALAREQVVPQVPQSVRVRMLVSHPLRSLSSQSSNPAAQVATRQTPVEHSPTPELGVQATPQAPQLKLVLSGVSHPLAALPSQFDQPALQVSSSQVPVEQLAAALARLQEVPQVPQLARVVVGVSQPLPRSPSQSAEPVLQEIVSHVPDAQDSLAFGRSQVTPQAPQLVRLVSGVSQPLASTPSQLENPALQLVVVHVPDVQVAAPLARLHGVPQDPQSLRVVMGVSQPLASMPSQLENPGLQLRILHAPEPQVAVALAREHVVPQAPQLARFVSAVSHPLDVRLSQSSKPGLQLTNSHTPVLHDSLAPGRSQSAPHAPQFERVVVGVSQPLLSMPSQLAQPVLQDEIAQNPPEHVAAALAREHGVPHEAQSVKVRILVSQPVASLSSQSSKPAAQVVTRHDPVEHSPAPEDGAHATPQAPQLALVLRGVSQPLAALPSQSDQPGLQLRSSQVPVEQLEAALARLQEVPHAPQLARVVIGVSQPLESSESQSEKPALQLVISHAPVSQLSDALARSHRTPHAPQLVRVVSAVSQPLTSTPSQLAKPASQPAVWHDPVAQVSGPLAREHSRLHSPQSVTVRRLVSQPLAARPSQSSKPLRQLETVHTPVVQSPRPLVGAQATPQPPQLVLVVVGVSQPLAALPSQSDQPVLQLAMPQVPPSQSPTAFAGAHATPHAPQLASVSSEVSQPLESNPSQSSKLASHVSTRQLPAAQTSELFARLHVAPQVPQSVNVSSGVSQPLASSPSQSPQPDRQEATSHRPAAHLGTACGRMHATAQSPQWAMSV